MCITDRLGSFALVSRLSICQALPSFLWLLARLLASPINHPIGRNPQALELAASLCSMANAGQKTLLDPILPGPQKTLPLSPRLDVASGWHTRPCASNDQLQRVCLYIYLAIAYTYLQGLQGKCVNLWFARNPQSSCRLCPTRMQVLPACPVESRTSSVTCSVAHAASTCLVGCD